MKTWKDIFSPVAEKFGGIESRPQQEVLGQAVIDCLATPRSVLLGNAPTGSGKSFATLVPAINKGSKVVFSVTTTALQDQVYNKDLKFLHSVYGGFTYASLKGRGQYLCLNNMKNHAVGWEKMNRWYSTLDGASLDSGERSEVEKRIGNRLSDYEWSCMAGDAKQCVEFKCDGSVCYSTRAREKAMGKDIVVVNHSVLIADNESRNLNNGFLETFDTVIVDEAHELENAMIGFLTERVNEWELQSWVKKICKGMEYSNEHGIHPINERAAMEAINDIQDIFDEMVEFYYLISEDWENEVVKVSKKGISSRWSAEAQQKGKRLNELINENLYNNLVTLHQLYGDFDQGVNEALRTEEPGVGVRRLSVARNNVKRLYEAFKKVHDSCNTSRGYSIDYGVPYAVLMDGYVNKKSEIKGSLLITPLDVSAYSEGMFDGKTCVFVSATMKDLSAGENGDSFRYFKESLGLVGRDCTEIDLEAVFDYSQQQVVYLSADSYSIGRNRKKGVKHSLEEMTDLIHAAQGRTLILFTSKAELEEAHEYLMKSDIDYPLYIQGGDLSKQELVDVFMQEKNSVLLGSKSFFTGVDFHGESCSLVILVKFPNPRFDDLCKLRLDWWKKKGYSTWYEREALSVFQQGAGRLIRSTSDTGVVAVLDKRAVTSGERVQGSVKKGVLALGSPVTRDISDVREFLTR